MAAIAMVEEEDAPPAVAATYHDIKEQLGIDVVSRDAVRIADSAYREDETPSGRLPGSVRTSATETGARVFRV